MDPAAPRTDATDDTGDLAMFVAATIRDKVVQEQQTEICNLKGQVGQLQSTVTNLQRKLQESNPIRPVCLVTFNKATQTSAVIIHSEFHAEEIGHQDGPIALFGNDMDDVVLPLGELVTAHFCVDEEYPSSTDGPQTPVPVPAVCLQNLEYTSVRFVECSYTLQRFCQIRATWGMEDLSIVFSIGPLSVQDYAQLTGAQVFAPDAQDETILDEREHSIPVERLQTLHLSETPAKLFLSGEESPIHCSADFLFEHLRVPYAP